ncbi:MAG: Crp/Fnr family transcriptional regulator [Bacteroidota bacterium]
MINLTIDYLRRQIPGLKGDLLVSDIAQHGVLHRIPEGQVILREDQHVDHVPLVGKGGVKVIRQTAENSIFLYFIQPGETCTMTLASCLRRQTSQVHALTIVDTEIILLPAEKVYYYTKHFPSWNEFTLESFRMKFDDILGAYDRLAFLPLEERILSYLEDIARIRQDNTLTITHAQLAAEMAARRVSVSRILK